MRRTRATKATKQTPKVTVGCVADAYSRPHERVIEFTFPSGKGGLISFTTITLDDGRTEERVNLYRVDPGVRLIMPGRIDGTTTIDPGRLSVEGRIPR